MSHVHTDGCEGCVPEDELELAEELACLRDDVGHEHYADCEECQHALAELDDEFAAEAAEGPEEADDED